MRRFLNPHLVVSAIQVVVAVLGTIGIVDGTRSALMEMGLGAVLVFVTTLPPAAAHAAITRRQAARQVVVALKRVGAQQS